MRRTQKNKATEYHLGLLKGYVFHQVTNQPAYHQSENSLATEPNSSSPAQAQEVEEAPDLT